MLGRRAGLAVIAVLALAAGALAVVYPRQTRAYLTHWRGSPHETSVYEAPTGDVLVRVAVAGDVGDSGTRLRRTAGAMAEVAGERAFDVLLLLGDNVYPSGDPRRLDETVLKPFAPVLDRGTKLLAIVGNHDVRDGHGPLQMAALGMPGLWWATQVGPVLFIGLDSNRPDDPLQRAWLKETLAATTATWKVVSLHHPPYSAGFQGSSQAAREAFSPLFATYGVQLVLSGHDHDYQRSKPIDGVTYVVSGGAAGSRRTSSRDYTARSFSWHHFVELDVFEGRLVGRAVNQDARVADTWLIAP